MNIDRVGAQGPESLPSHSAGKKMIQISQRVDTLRNRIHPLQAHTIHSFSSSSAGRLPLAIFAR